jgi:gliding motility-associated-like protein
MSMFRKFLLLLLIGGFGILFRLQAQPCGITQLADTVYACPNSTVQLNATISGPYHSFRWIPTQGLSDSTVLNPVATIGATPVSYTLVVYSFLDTNLVLNGDFEQGYVNFTTPGYTLNCNYPSSPGQVCVCTNPSIKHPNLFQTDHTTGTGYMLYVDPLTTAGLPVWRQTVNVAPNRNYLFEGWLNNASLPTIAGPDPNIVQLQINNTLLGQPGMADRVPDIWVPFSAVWNSGANTTATLEIVNLNPTHGGNDYVLDDISLRAVCVDSVRVEIVISPPAAVDLGPDITICADSVLLASSVSYSNPSYQWNTNATSGSIYAKQSGTYWLEVSDNGCPPGRDTIEVNLQGTLNVDLGPDTAICETDAPLVLSAPQPSGAHYLWSNGFSTSEMEVTRSGTFWVYVTYNGCEGSDTINVEVVTPPEIFIGGYQVICASVPETIGAEVAGASYLWNTGSTTSHISVNQTGLYWLQVNLKGCITADSAYIVAMPDPPVDLGPDGYICTDETLELDAGNPNCTYRWSTGAVSRTVSVGQPGVYHVTVISPDSCIGRDTISLVHLPDPVVQLPADTVVCEETPLLIKPAAMYAHTLTWSDGSTEAALTVKYGGQYTVTAGNECGMSTDTIHIQQIFCDIWVPNAFTPNGDGVNDKFRVLGNVGRTEAFGFSIYNRWGERIFHTSDRYQGWDGNHSGVPAPVGTYVYVVEYNLGGKPVVQKGSFHLVR